MKDAQTKSMILMSGGITEDRTWVEKTRKRREMKEKYIVQLLRVGGCWGVL